MQINRAKYLTDCFDGNCRNRISTKTKLYQKILVFVKKIDKNGGQSVICGVCLTNSFGQIDHPIRRKVRFALPIQAPNE